MKIILLLLPILNVSLPLCTTLGIRARFHKIHGNQRRLVMTMKCFKRHCPRAWEQQMTIWSGGPNSGNLLWWSHKEVIVLDFKWRRPSRLLTIGDKEVCCDFDELAFNHICKYTWSVMGLEQTYVTGYPRGSIINNTRDTEKIISDTLYY